MRGGEGRGWHMIKLRYRKHKTRLVQSLLKKRHQLFWASSNDKTQSKLDNAGLKINEGILQKLDLYICV